jgi:hypothetical protein
VSLNDALTIVGVPAIAILLLYALSWYLRRAGFASTAKVEFIEQNILEKFLEHKRHNNARVEQVRSLTLGNQDMLADQHARIEALRNQVSEIERYGSKPTQFMMRKMQRMQLQQALIARAVGAEVIELDEEDFE